MPRFHELIPDAKVLLALEPEEIAAAILEVLNSTSDQANHFHPGNFANSITEFRQSPYPLEQHDAIRNVLGEAFMWLEREGLIAKTTPGYRNLNSLEHRKRVRQKNL